LSFYGNVVGNVIYVLLEPGAVAKMKEIVPVVPVVSPVRLR
jgi:hypothetical protein